MSSSDIVIDVRNISKRYEIYDNQRDRFKQLVLSPVASRILGRNCNYFREHWALNDIAFQVHRGETLGIIGRNGSGKSTLLQIIAGTLAPTKGSVVVQGRVAALLELGSGFDPEFTGRENVFLNCRILGLTQKQIESRYAQIIEFADIGDFIEQPVKTYSSGMFLRLAFAVQAHIDASVVIIDEALAVGDVFFRQKCYARLEKLRDSGAAVLLVSHSMPDIEQYCRRAILLDHGTQRFTGTATEATKYYYLINQGDTDPPLRARQEGELRPTPLPSQAGIPFSSSEGDMDIASKNQIGNGQAFCSRFSVYDAQGQPCKVFHQGETAVFFYDFTLTEAIGVPICGIVISNDKGIIVHGKHSWQYDIEIKPCTDKGTTIHCCHKIVLDLAPGEYTLEIGIASVPPAVWEKRTDISHEEFPLHVTRICHIANLGPILVGLAQKVGKSVLTHHGIANLPGNMSITLETPQPSATSLSRPAGAAVANGSPT